MTRILLIALLTLGALAPAAGAHVTLQPSEAAAGGFTRLDVRVPNERDDAGTTKVDVQFPDGVIFLSYEPVPGWKVEITKKKLDKPVDAGEGFEVDEGIDRVTWTAGKETRIAPGQFQDFGISLRVPDGKAGDKLTFKALQTYEGGEVVRWIGAEDADEPAPVVTLTAAEGEHGGAHEAAVTPTPAAAAGGEEDDSSVLPIIALVAGLIGLGAGLAALATARRARPAT